MAFGIEEVGSMDFQ